MRSSAWEKYIEDTSFKFLVTAFNHTIPQWRQKDVVEGFSYMDFRGKIEMKNPDITLAVFEECTWSIAELMDMLLTSFSPTRS